MIRLACIVAVAATTIGCANGLGKHNLPPAQMLSQPGPGTGGPGPGVMQTGFAGPAGPALLAGGGAGLLGGVHPAMLGAGMGGDMGGGMGPRRQTSQLAFVGPAGTSVRWDVSQPGMFDSEPLTAPGRQNFPQGAIYRMKLTTIPGRAGVELYPTIEVAPANPRTAAYLSHNAIPVQFTQEDLDQVNTGNFVTKVIYLPDAEYQELAVAGVETLVSTRLDPGVDPVTEADRRGSIMAIIRLGNKDFEIPGNQGAAVMDGQVRPAGFNAASGAVNMPVPVSFRAAMPSGPMPMAQVPISGVNMPQYGMITSGTPIGLQGPPHIPYGGPAGLQSHSIRNLTWRHIPRPTKHRKTTVMQSPGMSYPKPPSNQFIHERNFSPGMIFRNPFKAKLQQAP